MFYFFVSIQIHILSIHHNTDVLVSVEGNIYILTRMWR